MKREKPEVYILGIILGLGLLTSAFIMEFIGIEVMDKYLGLMIGIGSGLGATSIAGYYSYRQFKKKPELKKKLDIEINDERNMLIKGKAAVTANSVMIYLVSAVVILFTVLDVTPIIIIALSVLLCVRMFLSMFLFNYYEKRL